MFVCIFWRFGAQFVERQWWKKRFGEKTKSEKFENYYWYSKIWDLDLKCNTLKFFKICYWQKCVCHSKISQFPKQILANVFILNFLINFYSQVPRPPAILGPVRQTAKGHVYIEGASEGLFFDLEILFLIFCKFEICCQGNFEIRMNLNQQFLEWKVEFGIF